MQGQPPISSEMVTHTVLHPPSMSILDEQKQQTAIFSHLPILTASSDQSQVKVCCVSNVAEGENYIFA